MLPQFPVKPEENGVRWGVVLTVNEPSALVESNVRWHLATGAKAVFVFLDDPHDPSKNILQGIPGCTVQLCDDTYWQARRPEKGRPPSQMRRQTINANRTQNRCDLDWLFHIDADEFIWQDGDLGAELTTHEDPRTELNLPVCERLFPTGQQQSLFEGAFRATSDLTPENAETAFGLYAPFMKRGQYSHGAGKSGVRVGAGLRLGVHNATRIGSEGRQRRAAKRISTTSRVLHFDGLTPLHWLTKVLRYRQISPEVQSKILQPHRAGQIAWMMERADTVDTALQAHHSMFALTDERRAQLDAFGLLRDIPFEPDQVLGAHCPDLDPCTFDADLIRRNPWLSGVMGD
ncbi:glycosyltransferase family 2 protein [uncultured Tateyamaria sp.]|uniref:glycosyltransferase family 2 protein n=1 Tax=uncultured Tateyamaria sp. TaxID=455651 RepID=UPI002625EECE|nr:glycosyltransferase family 2 protein [uncultured Tateyamaria sp.]